MGPRTERVGGRPANPRFVHLLNPVLKPPGHELSIAQPVTFESIRRARDYFRHLGGGEIELVCAVFEEDLGAVPPDVTTVGTLTRSLRDVSGDASAPHLPIAADLLRLAQDASKADYVVLTNLDIALMPNFYASTDSLLRGAWESLIINRRTIRPAAREPGNLLEMYTMVGDPHPGYDCFVFNRALLERIDLGEVCIGLPGFDWLMALNLWFRSANFTMKEAHLTFHIGDDKQWETPAMERWRKLNGRAMDGPIARLRQEFGDHPNLEWPRPRAPRRSVLVRGLNWLGRTLTARFPARR